MSAPNVKIKPMRVFLGVTVAQVQLITCVADVAGSLNTKWFQFQDAAGVVHYCWFDSSAAGDATDPAPNADWTTHEVDLTAGDTAEDVAGKLATVIGAVTGFDAVASGALVTLTHTVTGYAVPASDGALTGATGFTFDISVYGDTETDAGCIDGNIELGNLAKDLVPVTCHASGTTVLDELISGYALPELTLAFKETTVAKLRAILVKAGSKPYLPKDEDSTEVVGMGLINVGEAVEKFRVRLHPVARAANDYTEDWTFWQASLEIDSFTFSGEEISTIPVTMKIYNDETKNPRISFFMIGNASQTDLLA